MYILLLFSVILISCNKSNRDVICGRNYKYWIAEYNDTVFSDIAYRARMVWYFDNEGKYVVFSIGRDGIYEDISDELYVKNWELLNDSLLVTSDRSYQYKILEISEGKILLENLHGRQYTLQMAPNKIIPSKYRRKL